jgi:protein ImuA
MGSPVLLQWDAPASLRAQLLRIASRPARFSRKISVSKEIDTALPWRGLPLGCIHELQSVGVAGAISLAALLSARMPEQERQTIYVSARRGLHAAGLKSLGLRPETWIHISARRTEDLAWATLEALRCPRVGAVLSELASADLTLSRRLQLAAEEHGTTCFLLGDTRASANVASVITRWRVTPIIAPTDARFNEPCWDLDLTYCRGGQSAHWSVAWRNAQLETVESAARKEPTRRAPFVETHRLAG